MRRSAVKYVLVAVFVALALAAGYLVSTSWQYREASSIGRGVKDFKELSDRLVALSERRGAEYAFEVLRRAELPPNTDLHLLGHVVGDELYKQRGVDGVAICTQDFRNACSHSVVIGALNEYGGEPALEMIREACKKAPGGPGAYTMCYHGLGHGVLAFYGYDFAPTIKLCKESGTEEYHNREYVECVGGAVMELVGGGGHGRDLWLASRARYLRDEEPLSPCMSDVIPENIKSLCLVYLTPRLWEIVGIDLGRPDPALFPKAFALCDVLPRQHQELRDACFGGFGKEFVPLAGARDIRGVDRFSDEDYMLAIEWCGAAPAADGLARHRGGGDVYGGIQSHRRGGERARGAVRTVNVTNPAASSETSTSATSTESTATATSTDSTATSTSATGQDSTTDNLGTGAATSTPDTTATSTTSSATSTTP